MGCTFSNGGYFGGVLGSLQGVHTVRMVLGELMVTFPGRKSGVSTTETVFSCAFSRFLWDYF